LESARAFWDSFLAQNSDRKPLVLSLRGLRLGPTSVSCLSLQLRERPYTKLDMSENALGDHSALSLRSLIRVLPDLKHLNIAGNLISAEGAEELAEELQTNSTLEVLSLGGVLESTTTTLNTRAFRPNSIGAEGLRAMGEALSRNPNLALKTLNLCNTSLCSEAGKHLATFLEKPSPLENLDLSKNPLGSEGVCAILAQASNLHFLDISDTHCRGELIHAQLGNLLRSAKHLQGLSLANNPIETRALTRISKGVVACESLQSLSLENTGLTAEGARVLVEALLGAETQTLVDLNVSNNKLSQLETTSALAELIRGYKTLKVLQLSQNPIGDAGIFELVEAIRNSEDSQLESLDVSTCRIGTNGANYLFACLADRDVFRTLKLSDNFLDESLDIALIDRLKSLHDLQLSGNRLSHASRQVISSITARNRQREKQAEPTMLRSEMHRLLCQEAKLESAREQVNKDEAEVAACKFMTEQIAQTLANLRANEADAHRQVLNRIDSEERQLEDRWQALVNLKERLATASTGYATRLQELRTRLEERERILTDLQVKSEEVQSHFDKRKAEHPKELQSLVDQKQAALAEAANLREQANTIREQLKKYQDQTLVDLKQ